MKLDNFRLLLLSTSVSTFVGSILGPFYILYVKNLGGTLENFGLAFGLMAIAQSFTYYFIGKYSDKFGRKPFLVFSNVLAAATILAYVFIRSVLQLFTVQVIYGIEGAIWGISEMAFLGDVTKKKSRGSKIGKYKTIIGFLSGIAIIIGGIAAQRLGVESLFYVTSFFTFVSTIPLLYIKEK
jgi:MFS family permease